MVLLRIEVTMTLPRESASVPLARRTLATALASAGVDPDCVGEVEVALSEACTNVLLHAGRGETYDLRIVASDEQVTMDVQDTGAGFGNLPVEPRMAATDAEVGRGMALMRALTDQAVFDSAVGGGGSVHLVKRLRWGERRVGGGDAQLSRGDADLA